MIDGGGEELILVVDDSAANRYIFQRSLRKAGYRVLEAASGEEAFAQLEGETPDLILLDVQLPGMDGHQVCAAIKSKPRFKSIPIIQTSANYTSAEDYSRGVECGADAYLASPIEPLILLSNIRAWLRVKKLNEALQEQMRRQQEQETREKEWLMRLIGALPFPVLIVQSNGKLLSLNEAAAHFFRELPVLGDDFLRHYGQSFWLEEPEEGRRLEFADLPSAAALARGEVSGRELLLRIGAQRFYVVLDLKVVPSLEEGQLLYLLSFLDVTAVHESRLLLASTVQELHREQVLREQFVATLTHDLRTPLSTISINTEILRLKCGADPQCAQVLRMMQDNLKRASEMVANLLDFHKVLSGHALPVRREPCDLATLASTVVKEMQALHGDRIVLRAQPGIQGLCDLGALRRVLDNLLGNALKYGAAGTPVTLSISARDGQALLSVHNVGNPLGEEERGRLFRPFQRSEKSYTQAQQGWGLGLTIVKGLVEAHGGNVTVDSDHERGTTFTVELPLQPSAST